MGVDREDRGWRECVSKQGGQGVEGCGSEHGGQWMEGVWE